MREKRKGNKTGLILKNIAYYRNQSYMFVVVCDAISTRYDRASLGIIKINSHKFQER